MPVTLLATAVPLPPLPIAVVLALDQRTVTGVPPRSDKYTQGLLGGGYVAADNYNASVQDILAKYGTGTYAIMRGYGLSIGTGLNVDIAPGQAVVTGLTESKVTIVKSVDPSIARIQIWLNADGTITTVNNSLTPPAGEVCYLGSCVTDGSNVTSVDTSGVVFYKHGHTWRETADTGVPGDAPGLERRFYHRTANATYYWDGLSYILMAGSTVREGLEANVAGEVAGDVYEGQDGWFRELSDGSSFNQYGPSHRLFKPTAFSTWTNRGAVESSKSELGGGLYLEAATTASKALAMYVKAAPSTPYTVTFGVVHFNWQVATNKGGVCFRETSSSKVITWHLEQARGAAVVANWTNHTTQLSLSTFDGVAVLGTLMWWRITDDGVNLIYEISMDGRNFEQRFTAARGTHFTTAPDEYGFFVDAENANRRAHITILSVEVT